MIDAAHLLGVKYVGTFVGRNYNKTIKENFDEFEIVFKEILEYAKSKNVSIIIENCPMPGWNPMVDGWGQYLIHLSFGKRCSQDCLTTTLV